ncbi:MAG TPA: FAD-binding protein, partial [Anaerolineales bacterium]
MDVDVIIVGAGLAGLSAANEIASRSRASVIVVERLVIGANNPTPMTFVDVLGRFGLEECTLGRYNQFAFHSPLGNQSTHAFGEVQLVALAYQRACLKLLDTASMAGNVWMYSASATRLDRQEKGWLMTLNDG